MKSRRMFLCLPVIALVAGVYMMIATPQGAAVCVRFVPLVYSRAGNVTFSSLQGTLVSGVTLTGVCVTGASYLPPGSTLEIQQLTFQFVIPLPSVLMVRVSNGSVRFAGGDVLRFRGSYRDGLLEGNVYTPHLNVTSLRQSFPRIPPDVRAEVTDVDMYVRGTILKPAFYGRFIIAGAARASLELRDAVCVIDLEFRRLTRQLFGTVQLTRGSVSGANGVSVRLGRSRLTFVGPLHIPLLDIKGQASVGDTRISCSLTGTPSSPEIELHSRPPLPKERLLFMLATGKNWNIFDQEGQKGISADAIRDFIDFFILAGSGSRSAGRLGIKDVSVRFSELAKGAAFSVGLTKRFDARYGISQTTDETGVSTMAQTVGGEYRVADRVYVGAQQELGRSGPAVADTASYEDQAVEGNRTIYMKFRTEF